jgi:hypothetical protein
MLALCLSHRHTIVCLCLGVSSDFSLHFLRFSCYRRAPRLGRASAREMLKQNVARQLREPESGSFWQARYYDFNGWTGANRIEELRYIHRNPAVRGLVSSPELRAWSSFRHYASGFEGVVEIESQWTARKRELLGRTPQPL